MYWWNQKPVISMSKEQIGMRYKIRNWFKDNWNVEELAFFISSLSFQGVLNLYERGINFETLNKYYKNGDLLEIEYRGATKRFYATYKCNLSDYDGEVFCNTLNDLCQFPVDWLDEETDTWVSDILVQNDLYGIEGYNGPEEILFSFVSSSTSPLDGGLQPVPWVHGEY